MGLSGSDSADAAPDSVIAILGALDREIHPLRLEIGLGRKIAATRPRLWSGSHASRKIVLVQTGSGPERAGEAVRAVLSSSRVEVLMAIGYACGLKPEMGIGDLLLADRVRFWNIGESADPGGMIACDPRLIRLAEGLPGRFPKGRSLSCDTVSRPVLFKGSLVTVPRIIESRKEKRAVAEGTGASGLDMESAVIAGAAAEAGIPFMAIRSISDLVDEDLAGVSCFTAMNEMRGFLRAMLYLVFHPQTVRMLNRLRTQTSIASFRLADFVHELLHVIAKRDEN